jgi:predicted RNase H-like HicB family nuclease
MSPFPYRVVVRWSEPDTAYVAEVPAFPGAGGDGETMEEAAREAQESVRLMLEVKQQHGDPIPAPDIDQPEFSGQVRLRMPRSMHRRLTAVASKEGVSLNHLMVTYLAAQLERETASTAKAVTCLEGFVLLPDLSSGAWESTRSTERAIKLIGVREGMAWVAKSPSTFISAAKVWPNSQTAVTPRSGEVTDLTDSLLLKA